MDLQADSAPALAASFCDLSFSAGVAMGPVKAVALAVAATLASSAPASAFSPSSCGPSVSSWFATALVMALAEVPAKALANAVVMALANAVVMALANAVVMALADVLAKALAKAVALAVATALSSCDPSVSSKVARTLAPQAVPETPRVVATTTSSQPHSSAWDARLSYQLRTPFPHTT